MDAKTVIKLLDLSPLPYEGGYFRRTFTSKHCDSTGFSSGTAIYYLITPESGSALHRLRRSDELFHYYSGDPVEMALYIEGADTITYPLLGNRLIIGETPQILVSAGVWQGMRLQTGGKWALLGTTVTPGYQDQDFELASPKLLESLPHPLKKEMAPWLANA